MRRFAVVGGGLLGLTLAHRLARAGVAVTVFEGAPTVGGLASSWTVGDVTWDRFYHVTLLSDTHTRGLLGDLGLDDDLRWVTTRTGAFADGRLHPLSNPAEYLRFPALGVVDKARLAATILWGSRVRDWRALERTPVAAWLTRWSGRRTFERFWLPLLKAKVGDAWPETSAAFIWATIQRLYAARRAGLGDERFGYVSGGGYARTLGRLGEVLADEGVDVRCSSPVSEVARDGESVTVRADHHVVEGFDDVVVTAAPPVAARLCPQLRQVERDRLAAVRYQGVVCTSVVLRRPLAGYYLTYLTDEQPMTTVIEMTALVDPAELGGHTLVYLPRYVAADDPLLDAPDEEVERRFLAGLRVVHPDVSDDDVVAVRTARARYVFPLPVLRYSETVAPVHTSVPGLHLVHSAQIVNGTLNANETIQLAEDSVPALLETPVPA